MTCDLCGHHIDSHHPDGCHVSLVWLDMYDTDDADDDTDTCECNMTPQDIRDDGA